MTCAPHICSQGPVADCLPTSSLATTPCSPSSGSEHVADPCRPGSMRVGCRQTCTSTAETSEISTSGHGPESWIASQRDFLARIFRALAAEKESLASVQVLSGRCSEQLTLFGQDWCSSKTRQKSGKKVDATLSGLLWREDIPGETERLPRLPGVRV